MSVIFQLAAFAISIFIVLLIARAVFDWIRSLARGWRPAGLVLLLANISYALTDPPINALRRVLPPLNLGGIALDLGFLIVLIVLMVVRSIFLILASAF